jgi:hypothetical protein
MVRDRRWVARMGVSSAGGSWTRPGRHSPDRDAGPACHAPRQGVFQERLILYQERIDGTVSDGRGPVPVGPGGGAGDPAEGRGPVGLAGQPAGSSTSSRSLGLVRQDQVRSPADGHGARLLRLPAVYEERPDDGDLGGMGRRNCVSLASHHRQPIRPGTGRPPRLVTPFRDASGHHVGPGGGVRNRERQDAVLPLPPPSSGTTCRLALATPNRRPSRAARPWTS